MKEKPRDLFGRTEPEPADSFMALQLAAFWKVWARYPQKDGKSDALRHYRATVKTAADFARVEEALDRYEGWLKVQNSERDWLRPKQGKTWFHNWQDWLEDERAGFEWSADSRQWVSQNGRKKVRSGGYQAFTGDDYASLRGPDYIERDDKQDV